MHIRKRIPWFSPSLDFHIKIMVYYVHVRFLIVHGLFILHLLNTIGKLIIKIKNTYILWLKIFIIDSPPFSVIQHPYSNLMIHTL